MDLENHFLQESKKFGEILEKSSATNLKKLTEMFEQVYECIFIKKRKIAIIGNGGSAAEATHIASEFVSKCIIDHEPLPVLSFTDSLSSITAIGNDYGFDQIFARQVRAFLTKGDMLICLSTSGKSTNILKAMEVAVKQEVHTYLWTGNHNLNLKDIITLEVSSIETPRIQEVHLFWGHQMAEYIERRINEI